MDEQWGICYLFAFTHCIKWSARNG